MGMDFSVSVLSSFPTFLYQNLMFNSAPAELRGSKPGSVRLTTLSRQARCEGGVAPPGTIRSHPRSSVAAFPFARATLEVGQTIQRLQRGERIHVQRLDLFHHRVTLGGLAEEGQLSRVA